MKIKLFILCLTIAIALCSCATNTGTTIATEKQNTQSSSFGETKNEVSSSEAISTIKLSEHASVIPLDYKKENGIIGIFDNNLILTKVIDNKNESGNYTYYNYDIISENLVEIGEFKNIQYSSDNHIIMNDKMYMTYKGSELVEFNLRKSEQKTIKKLNFRSPYQHFKQLNEKEFIIYGFDFKGEESEITEYYIKKFNIQTNTLTDIFSVESDEKNKAEKIICVYTKNNNILAVCYEGNKGQTNLKLKAFDSNGKLLKTTSLNYLNNELNDFKVDVVVKNDVLIFHKLSNDSSLTSYKLFKNSNDKFNSLLTNEDLSTYKFIQNSFTNDKSDEVYFVNNETKTLKIYNTKTNEFKTVQIEMESNYNYLSSCFSDEKGNLVIETGAADTFDNNDFKIYLIKKENIK